MDSIPGAVGGRRKMVRVMIINSIVIVIISFALLSGCRLGSLLFWIQYSRVIITEPSQRPDPVNEPIQACHDVVADGGEGDNCNCDHIKMASFLVCFLSKAVLAYSKT